MNQLPARLVAVSLLLSLVLPAPAAVRTEAPGPQALRVDGTACPELVRWSGGDLSASIAVDSSGTPPKKHVANVATEPIVVEVALPLSAGLQASLAGLCTNSPATQTLVLTNQGGEQLQASNALLVEARFPALDASSHEALRLTLVFRASSVQPVANPTPITAGGAVHSRATVNDFRVTLAGLSTTRVSRVEPFVISRAPSSDGVGLARDATAAPGPLQIPDLSLWLSASGSADWIAWRNDFLGQGNSTDNREKSGSLELLAPDLQTVLVPLQLSHVGLKRLAQPPAEGEFVRLRADLYCEAITVAASPAEANGPVTNPPPADTPPPTTNPPPTTTEPTNAPTETPAPAAETPAPTEPKPPLKEAPPLTDKAPIKNRALDVPAAARPSSVANPDDKGPRDPADFPRYPGTTRTAYRGSRNPSVIEETADYSGPGSSGAAMDFFDQQLRGRGWTETSRYETEYGAKGGSKIISTWTKDKRKASVTIWDSASDRIDLQSSLQQTL